MSRRDSNSRSFWRALAGQRSRTQSLDDSETERREHADRCAGSSAPDTRRPTRTRPDKHAAEKNPPDALAGDSTASRRRGAGQEESPEAAAAGDRPGQSTPGADQTVDRGRSLNAVDLTPGEDSLSPEQRTARREALRSMLHRSEARYRQVTRSRRPVLAAGSQVRITAGPRVGQEGTIIDADYIENRVLLSLGPDVAPAWVDFDQVGAPRNRD